MKRFLKNILNLAIIALACAGMLLSMFQIRSGQDFFTFVSDLLPDPSVLLQQPPVQEDPFAQEDLPDGNQEVAPSQNPESEEPLKNEEPSQESKEDSKSDEGDSQETAARRITVYPVQMDEEPVQESQPEDKPDAKPEKEPQPEPEGKPEGMPEDFIPDYDPVEYDGIPHEADKPARQIVLATQQSDGTWYILGVKASHVLVFAAEGLIAAGALLILLMSGFHKKTLKETFSSFDKCLIWVLCTLLGGTALTGSSIYITRRYFEPAPSQEQPSHGMEEPGSQPPAKPEEKTISYRSVTRIDKDATLDFGDYLSDQPDQNALLVQGAAVSLSQGNVEKTGDASSLDDASFYGVNAAILADGQAQLSLDSMTIYTDGMGANGVFSYGDSKVSEGSPNTKVILSNSIITTQQDSSGGIIAAGGGQIDASDLQVATYGTSSAAIRSDRGGGIINVNGGSYVTFGAGSPAVYSTADLTISDAELTSNTSEGAIVEGGNSIQLYRCHLYDTNTTLHGLSDTYKNIFLYQSMSGDASEGRAWFGAVDSDITTNKGDTIYVTNTQADIKLQNSSIANLDPVGNFLRIEKGPWGKEGENGGRVYLELIQQPVSGNILVDELSRLVLDIKDGSSLMGALNPNNTASLLQVRLSANSTLTLTGDSYVTSVENEDTSWNNIDYNGYTLYVNGKGWNDENGH